MKRWIVNPRTREVRAVGGTARNLRMAYPGEGEFFFDAPTATDAMMAGERRALAEEALETADPPGGFVLVGDRIEPQPADGQTALCMIADLAELLISLGYNVWREGLGLVVLSKRATATEPISAWVSAVER